MARVEVRDHVLWIRHITGDVHLSEWLGAAAAGDTVELIVDNVPGQWRRMAGGRNGRPTLGLRPTGEAERAWRRLYATRRGQTVEVARLAASAQAPAPVASPLKVLPPVAAGDAPGLLAHADWSIDPLGRWEARATRRSDGRWRAHAPILVGPLDSYIGRLVAAAGDERVLVGFDFPIGVPRAYAESAGITDFAAVLSDLGSGSWADFYRPAERADEVSLRRPFYPHRPGGTKKAHLITALDVDEPQALLRRCDRRHAGRPKDACALFWVLGANQVGRGAIVGWRDLLAPALSRGDVGIWPFHGPLDLLLRSRRVVVAETYPGEVYGHLALPGGGSKRAQADRRLRGVRLLAWAKEHGVELTPELITQLSDGFGPTGDGEDPFDAVVGLFGLLTVVLGLRSSGEPLDDSAVTKVEGWILGRQT